MSQSDLTDLIARCEAATGSDRGLDALIWYALIEKPSSGQKLDRDMIDRWPRYTASVDEALALIERALPDGCPGLQKNRGTKPPRRWAAWLEVFGGEAGYARYVGAAPTPALALCLSLLRALQANETRP